MGSFHRASVRAGACMERRHVRYVAREVALSKWVRVGPSACVVALWVLVLTGCADATAESATSGIMEVEAVDAVSSGGEMAALPPSAEPFEALPGLAGGFDEISAAPAAMPAAMPSRAPSAARAGGVRASGPEDQRLAMADPPTPQQGASNAPTTEQASDAVDTSGPLLIYTANFVLAVFEVEEIQADVLKLVREMDGYLARQTNQMLTVRIPARRFYSFVEQLEEKGDVLNRNIAVQDVGEQFRDLHIRIRNAEAVRDRLEQMLARANNVNEALAVQAHLERITQQLEQMKGQIRQLGDRVAFSTVTVQFQPQPREAVEQPDIFSLPFPWLQQLGLRRLLNLSH